MNVDQIIEKVKVDPRFLKLKDVVENNTHHDHQSVYDHTMLVFNVAKEKLTAEFISNPEAKKRFLDFINERADEKFTRKDCMLLTALLHDIGKAASYKEDGVEKPVLKIKDGITSCPNHEYISSTIVPQILEDLASEKAIEYISKSVCLHDSINDPYFKEMKDWEMTEVIDNIKGKSQGLYIECLFNIYCDVYFAKPSACLREMSEKIFNSPFLYEKRNYQLA